MNTINVNGTLLDLSKPKVMGIINVTPDSFYSGSRKQEIKTILEGAQNMIEEGATFLDIGGYSSRPGATDISIDNELERVIEPIVQIRKELPEAIISVDTFRAKVAEQAIEAGANIINDISGGTLDPLMYKTAGKLQVPYVGMHMKGTPQTMKNLAQYDDLVGEISIYFARMLEKLDQFSVKDVILDPGFGFAKNIQQNFHLLNTLPFLQHLDKPMLIGLSRKSMIYKTLNIESEQALNGTTVLNTVALLKGASILRVHDVKEAVEAIELTQRLGD